MKQVIQSRRTGKLALNELPAPVVKAGHLLVETSASLISVGTERMAIEFAKQGLIGKARARPDLVKQVIEKVNRDGFRKTFETVMARLYEPLPLGYSASGVVKSVGVGLEGNFHVLAGCFADINQGILYDLSDLVLLFLGPSRVPINSYIWHGSLLRLAW